jgi:hypothetical protein
MGKWPRVDGHHGWKDRLAPDVLASTAGFVVLVRAAPAGRFLPSAEADGSINARTATFSAMLPPGIAGGFGVVGDFTVMFLGCHPLSAPRASMTEMRVVAFGKEWDRWADWSMTAGLMTGNALNISTRNFY